MELQATEFDSTRLIDLSGHKPTFPDGINKILIDNSTPKKSRITG